MHFKITAVAIVVCCLVGTEANAGFLTLPVNETSPSVRNGWYYTTSSPAYRRKHFATDYATTDGQEIIAACDGVAIATESWTDANGVGAYGHFTLERCNDLVPDSSHYMAIYAHLERSADYLAIKSRYDTDYASWTRVRRGDLVGYADQSGTTWPHVHFEIFTGDYVNKLNRRVDPYNLYGLARIYPGDGRGTGSTGYLWLTFPPLPPGSVDQDRDGFNMLVDCDDGNAEVHPGATELCNGRDDDCDTILDNWAYLGAACTVELSSSCTRSGTWVCSADETTIVCNADTTVGAERCDGIDNDCDGETDEDWRTGSSDSLGVACDNGLRGECFRTGVYVCADDGLGTHCNAGAGSRSSEICDGLDNDCNGYTDDFCLCEIAHPHPSCLCRRCDAPCSSHNCIVTSLSPFTYGCYWHGGCYYCGSLSPDETDWTCTSTLSCVEYVISEYCVDPEAAFCASYCPWPY